MKKKKMFIGLIVLIVFSGLVQGFAIAPGQKTFRYSSGMNETGRIRIINTESVPLYIIPNVEGPLSEYIFFDDSPLEIEASQGEINFYYSISIGDAFFEPGVIETSIFFTDKGTGEDIVKVSVSLPSMVRLMVPFEGKHPTSSIVVSEQPGEKIVFSIPVHNKGSEMIDTASVDLEIHHSDKVVDTLESGIISLSSNEEKTFHLKWSPSSDGEYTAVGKLYFDDSVMTLSKTFTVEGIPKELGFNKMRLFAYLAIFILAVSFVYQIYRPKKKEG